MSDCYKCKHRRNIPGDCYSQCNHPEALYRLLANLTSGYELPVKLDENYWARWPESFEKEAILECEFFEEK